MSTNPLKEVKARIELAFTEIGCQIPVVMEDDELIIRDVIVYVEKDEIFIMEASKPENPIFRMDPLAVNDIAASVAIHICKGLITRSIAKNYS